MNIKDKAMYFAINAHKGQVRKSEVEKPMIIHPLEVGKILESFGFDDNVVAAGYLHDVVEDTKYTIQDIEREFGSDVAGLVYTASEPDKSNSWEVRKKHTIDISKDLLLRNKAVICADKISNLESLMILFGKTGKRDFSFFKRGEKDQEWYYKSIYESLIYGEDEHLEMFKRLEIAIDTVFDGREDLLLKDVIFASDPIYYDSLKRIDYAKKELIRLKAFLKSVKPFVIEFTGIPRTGKTTTINNLSDFFKKGGFNTQIVEEFTTSKYFKDTFMRQIEGLNPEDRDILIIEEVTKQIERARQTDAEIVLVDRGINDRQIWNYRRYMLDELSKDRYTYLRDKYKDKSKELIDALVITYTDYLTSLKRDYLNSLALERRRFLNSQNINKYNEYLQSLNSLFNESVDNIFMIDTTNINNRDTSLLVAESIIPLIRKRYLDDINKQFK